MNILNENNRIVDAKYLEELMYSIQIDERVPKNLNSIKKVLNASFDGICKDIIINKDSDTLFGMSVYPSMDSLTQIASLISKGANSKEITKYITTKKIYYIIEIDGNILYNKLYEFTPGEIIAIMLHEIGHVVADTDFYNDLAFAYSNTLYELEKDKSKFDDYKHNRKDMFMAALYVLSAIETTHFKNRSSDDILKEQIADKFVVDNGYGKELSSALAKFSKVYMKSATKTKKDIENEIKLDANVAINLSNAMLRRKDYVDNVLKTEIKKSNSSVLSKLLTNIRDCLKSIRFTTGAPFNKEMVSEGFIDKFKKNPIKISQMDIDELRISAEMMDDWDDKSVLVYKIHKRISQLEKIKLELTKDDQINMCNNYIKQLNTLLSQVMKFKKVDKTYGVFIKYPKGYEG